MSVVYPEIPIITLTSDLGLQDFYVAIIKGVIHRTVKPNNIVDITHQIPDYDSFKAGEVLHNCFHFFPEGTIHCILINNESHIKAPLLLCKYQNHFFIGPDNGLFSVLFTEQPTYIVKITENLLGQKSSFPFKDFYLPAIQRIIQQKEPENSGELIQNYKQVVLFNSYVRDQTIFGYIWHIDKFGNCITNISRELFENTGKGASFRIEIKGHETTKLNSHYEDKKGGDLLIHFNSLDRLEIAISNGSAKQYLGLNRHDKIIIRFGEN